MNEPYRYACPECGSVDLQPRTRKGGYRCNNRHTDCPPTYDPVDKKRVKV